MTCRQHSGNCSGNWTTTTTNATCNCSFANGHLGEASHTSHWASSVGFCDRLIGGFFCSASSGRLCLEHSRSFSKGWPGKHVLNDSAESPCRWKAWALPGLLCGKRFCQGPVQFLWECRKGGQIQTQRKGREQLGTEASNFIATRGMGSHLMRKPRSTEAKTFVQGLKTCLCQSWETETLALGGDCRRADR